MAVNHTLLSTEQKTKLLGFLADVEENATQMYIYKVQGKDKIAKSFEDEMHAALGEVRDLVTPLVDNAGIDEASNVKNSIKLIDELSADLSKSKIVPVAKVACSSVSILKGIGYLATKFGSQHAEYRLGLEQQVCEHINVIPNQYDANAQIVTAASAVISQLLHDPMKLFVAGETPASGHSEL